MLQHKVHVKAVFQAQLRLVPLGDHGGFGVFLGQHGGDFPPDGAGVFFILGIVFHKAGRHVHPESIAAFVQPEPHHILDGLHGGAGAGGISGLLPGFPAGAVAVVQRGLAFEKVQNVGAVALGLTANEGHPVPPCKAGVGPDEPVGILVALRLAAGLEPLMLLAGVAGHQIQQHPDALFMGRVKQADQILVGAVAGRHLFVVPHIVARILEGGIKAGVDPQCVAAQLLDIVQLFNDAGDVTDAIAVGIVKGLRINFVENRVFQPLFHEVHSFVLW